MKLQLTKSEAIKCFYDALCNGLGQLGLYDLELVCDEVEYRKAKANIKNHEGTICYEDVLIQMLKDGYSIGIIDHEYKEYNSIITIEDVYNKISDTPMRNLLNVANEEGDADDADVLLQTVFFGEVVFG